MNIKINIKMIALSLALLTTQSVFAKTSNEIPDQCPAVSEMVSVGVDKIIKEDETWIAWTNHHFSTPQEWTVSVTMLEKIDNKEDALRKLNKNIKYLVLDTGPNDQGDGLWMCEYTGYDRGIIGLAFTPPYKGDLKGLWGKNIRLLST